MPPANLLGAVLGAVCLLGTSPTGAVFVTTLPADATVWIDGTFVGRSPAVVDALPAGSHHLTLARSGWKPRDLDVSVEPAQTATASVVLVRDAKGDPPDTGSIHLHLPAGARLVAVDGAPPRADRDGDVTANAGTHELTVTMPAGKARRTVTVYPQTRTEVVLHEASEGKSPVIAPVDGYLPDAAVQVEGSRVVVRYRGHAVNAALGERTYKVDGRAIAFDASPVWINSRLFLPIELITMLRANEK